jgi:TonB family protein
VWIWEIESVHNENAIRARAPLKSATTSANRPNSATGCNNVTCPVAVEITIRQPQVYYSIRHNLFENLPESATSGEHGVVVVRLHIQKDGSLPDKFMTIVSSSGKEDMDGAALSAIRSAAPFGRLPEAFLVPSLDLLFTFYFRSTPPPQKPKIVPVRIAANHIRESITTERP